MASYKFTGYITVEGIGISSHKEAIETLQIMLDDFGNMNPESEVEIHIHWDKLEKVKEVRD